ncbi:unnamed protein product [Callosobruchus maculatus]|uniref:Uncharacterized protein n=1 Tax=Callosobruchus maculatus TaxID=64391 RepID=A0A653C4M8_CALMS|nr:unnamed protein product [Callosobruchus maculatus]
MVITRELRDEIKNSVSTCIASILKEDDFFQRIAQKVTDSVIKTLEERISSLEQKVKEINLSNNNILADVKDETAMLKSENDLLMKKIDDMEQETRLNNLRIFKLEEREGENLNDKVIKVTIIPTYDTDVLGYWVAENEDLLAKFKIDLSPSASRCTINLQDHETSCSAYRLEF